MLLGEAGGVSSVGGGVFGGVKSGVARGWVSLALPTVSASQYRQVQSLRDVRSWYLMDDRWEVNLGFETRVLHPFTFAPPARRACVLTPFTMILVSGCMIYINLPYRVEYLACILLPPSVG